MKTTLPPPYPLTHIYTTLQHLGSLSPLLSNLQTKLLKDILLPLLSPPYCLKISKTTSDWLAIIKLDLVEFRNAEDVLSDISTILDFIGTMVYPRVTSHLEGSRLEFMKGLHSATWNAVLRELVVPSLPSTLAGVRGWLDLLLQAVEVESSTSPKGVRESPGENPAKRPVVKQFFETSAGTTWANHRRQRIGEEVRKLVLGGWGGWEGMEVEMEKVVVVEVEVDVDLSPSSVDSNQRGEITHLGKSNEDEGEGEEDCGWGFENDPPAEGSGSGVAMKPANPPPQDTEMVIEDGDERDFEAPSGDQPANEPSSVTSNGGPKPAEEEGWDFELSSQHAAQPKSVPKKPVKEAKKLAKKVALAKAKAAEEAEEREDENASGERSPNIGSGSVASMLGSLLGESGNDQLRDVQPEENIRTGKVDDEWGWEEPETSAPPLVTTRHRGGAVSETGSKAVHGESPEAPKKTVLREETRVVREKMLVSRACEKLMDLVERAVRECRDLQSAS